MTFLHQLFLKFAHFVAHGIQVEICYSINYLHVSTQMEIS
jgi:hypothetical protein